MRWHRQSVMAMVLMTPLIVPSLAMAEGAVTATLSVLAAPVERIAGDTGAPQPGVSGMDLAEGDRIRTGEGGGALITFLNGSTVTLLPESEVTVKQAPTGRARPAGIRLLIHAGRVWARVVQTAGSRSTLSLESNDYAATAHDGLIGAEQAAGTFVCWTRRGMLWLTDKSGQGDTVLVAGQRARARFGVPVAAEPFVAASSALEIRTTGPVVPLVRMPDGSSAAGFLAPDVEVNQVFGSLTEGKGRRWLVEVPGGHEGPYTLILTGTAAGPFTAQIRARYLSFTSYRQELRGEARPGERLFTRITQTVRGQDPQTARAVEASLDGLRGWDASEPAAVVAFPSPAPRPGVN
ncbi:MAG TPA: FecR domain-containing protein [Candidatus Deferrimicrobiaceae bacterium]|nr:FecR domain-containing protein [Candidatus Deferrimicrobiaceae bacterium]